MRGPDSSVGMATELRAGRSGIECRWGRDFPPVQTDSGAHSASCKVGTESFPGVEAAGAWGRPPPPSNAEVLERVKLYLYSPKGPSWPVKRVKPTYMICFLADCLLAMSELPKHVEVV